MKMFSGFRLLFTLARRHGPVAGRERASRYRPARNLAWRRPRHGGGRGRALPQGRLRISVTIVDSGGQTRLFHRDDGAAPHTADASFKKAYTARTYRTPSAEFMKRTEVGGGGRPGLRQINNVLGVPGGLPIKIGDETIGGIGIAGAPGDGDEGCAQAAIDRVADQLK